MKPLKTLLLKTAIWALSLAAFIAFYVWLVRFLDVKQNSVPFYTLVGIALAAIFGFLAIFGFIVARYAEAKRRAKTHLFAPLKSFDKKTGEAEQAKPFSLTLQTHEGDLIVQNPFRSILCIGSAGSGKSVSIERQLMKSAVDAGFCGLLYDFKYPSLTNELEGYLKAKKDRFPHYSVNFDDLTTSSRVNPLHPRYVQNSSYAREYATAIINNLLPESIEKKDFWVRSCTDLLTALVFWLKEEAPQYCTLPHAVALAYQDERQLISVLSQNLQCMGMIKSLETAMRNESNQQLTGVLSTLQSALSILNTPDVFYIFSGDEIPLELNDPARPLWLSIGNSPQLHDTYSPLLSLICTVALKQMNQPGKAPSLVLLDEAPTLFIPKLSMIPATARSNQVALAFFAQDLAQIVAQYGQKQCDVLMGNLNNQFFGRVSNPATAEHVSKLFGKHDQYFTTHSSTTGQSGNVGFGFSVGKNSGKTIGQSIQERDRIKPQDVVNFEVGQFCGVLVEGQRNEFKSRFKAIEASPAALPKRQSPNPEGMFQLIHKEAANLITERAGGSYSRPNGDGSTQSQREGREITT